jgi:hypothetical protein
MEVINKITVKNVCGKVDIIKLVEHHKTAPGTPLWMMEIYGIASDSKPGATVLPDGKTSNWIKFVGNFKALNIATGAVYRSGACILPGAIPDMLFGALGIEGNKSVEFAFRVGVKFNEDAATKYTFLCDSLMEVKENDPLERLEAGIKTLALAAPAAAGTSEPLAPAATGETAAPAAGGKRKAA